GLKPRADSTIEIDPLAPQEWDYFALDNLVYHGHRLCIFWDKTGRRYGKGAGLQLIVDGQSLALSPSLQRLTAELPPLNGPRPASARLVNYAVNNENAEFPKAIASFTNEKTPLKQLNDGNYWYTIHPPNRWTCEGSPN